ncbi:hypothetical protein EVAR_86830_1 [Eumeta japonica]|uniref:Uncharacterized protein n=1 Tax=Eumeta variegata TaxID=151549 RepID=A0A4C1VTM9_EUMVA|nr:hypothetical protein EVAR_86830_1 [Eumeta japonica]
MMDKETVIEIGANELASHQRTCDLSSPMDLQSQRSHQCLAGLLDRNRLSAGVGVSWSGSPELALTERNPTADAVAPRLYSARVSYLTRSRSLLKGEDESGTRHRLILEIDIEDVGFSSVVTRAELLVEARVFISRERAMSGVYRRMDAHRRPSALAMPIADNGELPAF